MRKIHYIVGTGIALLALLCIARKLMTIPDPLKHSGLTDKELLVFRYLLSIYEYSEIPLYDIPKDADSVRIFNAVTQVGLCKDCGAVFIDLDGACPNHHLLARMDKAMFVAKVLQWEELRDAYCKHIAQRTMTRIQAIRIHRMLTNPLER